MSQNSNEELILGRDFTLTVVEQDFKVGDYRAGIKAALRYRWFYRLLQLGTQLWANLTGVTRFDKIYSWRYWQKGDEWVLEVYLKGWKLVGTYNDPLQIMSVVNKHELAHRRETLRG